MVETKSTSDSVDAWEGAIPGIPGSYRRGIDAASDVVRKMIAAEDLWVDAVIKAANEERRSKGLEGLTDSEWKRLTRDKGATRIGPGMRAAVDKFRDGIGDVLDALKEVDLPDRTTDPMANIDNRVKPIVSRLVKLKTE